MEIDLKYGLFFCKTLALWILLRMDDAVNFDF
jgi:hypothetical protein